jgi:hypothetical protein
MPEYPDLTLYVEALDRFAVGSTLERIRIVGPTLLRSIDPPRRAQHGRIASRWLRDLPVIWARRGKKRSGKARPGLRAIGRRAGETPQPSRR